MRPGIAFDVHGSPPPDEGEIGMPPDDNLDALANALIARAGGIDEAIALLVQRADVENLDVSEQPGPGRPPTDGDDERLERVAWHLANDADLIERGRAGKPNLTEATRRAIRDLPGPGDIVDGRVTRKAVVRLLRKFKFLCLDVPGRGFDVAEWAPPRLA
jgi:hypothetical protein